MASRANVGEMKSRVPLAPDAKDPVNSTPDVPGYWCDDATAEENTASTLPHCVRTRRRVLLRHGCGGRVPGIWPSVPVTLRRPPDSNPHGVLLIWREWRWRFLHALGALAVCGIGPTSCCMAHTSRARAIPGLHPSARRPSTCQTCFVIAFRIVVGRSVSLMLSCCG